MKAIIEKNNFRYVNMRTIPDAQANLWEIEHIRSGAKLVWLDRADENMTFAIAFRTVPEDSTGVFHILEHSVLCGSDRYPVKEPFVELLKSSLQTFLNAMTFPDKTVYPVSSRNRKDFLNLVSVYMDAVLHPAITRKPEIFLQEGWRYELGENDVPVYQGVVYNEMKGAYSSVSSVLQRQMNRHLYPDNCYGKDSGGDPEHIPELSYQQFLRCHETFYHPSNAMIVLDGQVELDSVLELLDTYLKDYIRREAEFPIPMQEALPYREVRVPYEIGAGESSEGKTIVSRGCLFGTYADRDRALASQLLSQYLADGNEAPLKRAILDAGLGADVRVGLHDGIQQSWYGWQVWNTDADKVSEIQTVVRQTLEKLLRQGLDRDRLEAYYSSMAFSMMDRDAGGYRGVYEAINILESWLYGGDPAQNLTCTAELESLRAKLETDYFADMIRACLLDDSTGVLLVLEPSKTLGEQKQLEEARRLEKAWTAMSEEEHREVASREAALRAWQQSQDSPEALATIPVLKLSDVSPKPAPLSVTAERVGEIPLLCHRLENGLVYTDLYFNACDLTLEQLPVANLLCELLGDLPAAGYGSEALRNRVMRRIGELDLSMTVFAADPDRCRVYLSVHSVCLPENRMDTAQILLDILTDTHFNDPTLVRETLQQMKNRWQRALVSSGNQFASTRVTARLTGAGAANERLSGCEFIRWLNAQCENGNSAEKLLDEMAELARRIFTRDRLTVSVSQTVDEPMLRLLIQGLPKTGETVAETVSYPLLPPRREGIVIPSDVGYAVQGGNICRHGSAFNGSMYVLSKVLSLEYLWNVIRVQGGAYGAGFRGSLSGNILFHTYRDPDPRRSLGCFGDTEAFLREFCARGESLDRLILGAVADADPMRSSSQKMQAGAVYHFQGISYDDLCQIHRQILATEPSTLLDMLDVLRMALSDHNICVVGSRGQLESCGEQLDAVLEILA